MSDIETTPTPPREAVALLAILVIDEIQRARVAGQDLSLEDAARVVLRRYGLEADSNDAPLRVVEVSRG